MVDKLKKYKAMAEERDLLKNKLEEIETSLYFPGSQRITDMPSGQPTGNPREELAIKHIELLARYKAIKAELDSELLTLMSALSKLEKPMHRKVLRLRYIEGMKVAEICDREHYSRAQIHRIEKTALARLQEIAKELKENDPETLH